MRPWASFASGTGPTAFSTRLTGASRGPPRSVSARTTTGISTVAPISRDRARNARALWSPRARAMTAPESRISRRGAWPRALGVWAIPGGPPRALADRSGHAPAQAPQAGRPDDHAATADARPD